MKAAYYDEHGGLDVLKFGDVEDPVAGNNQVVVDVKSVSLNHIDLFLRRGLPGLKIPLPHIPGCDGAGVVSELGEGVTGIAVGDRVLINPSVSCGHCEFCARGDASLCTSYTLIGETIHGTCCEKIAIPSVNAIRIPDSLSFDAAASIPLVFLTAWRMMITRGRLRAGETVLILVGGLIFILAMQPTNLVKLIFTLRAQIPQEIFPLKQGLEMLDQQEVY